MRVHEFADTHDLTTEEVLSKCRDLRLDVQQTALAGLSDADCDSLRAAFDVSESSTNTESSEVNTQGEGFLVALLGVSGSGKSLFWASLTEELQRTQFDAISGHLAGWIPDIEAGPSTRSAWTIYQNILANKDLKKNDPGDWYDHKLTFEKPRWIARNERYTFRSFDVAGESVEQWLNTGQTHQAVLRRLVDHAQQAAGLILFIDPTQNIAWQDHLWNQLLRQLAADANGRFIRKPVLFVVTKCDHADVRDRLGMPERSQRREANTNLELRQKLTDHQDAAVIDLITRHAPKLHSLIAPRNPLRKVRNAHAIAISSIGQGIDDAESVDALEPWRIVEPFTWMISRLRPWRRRYANSIMATAASFLIILVLSTVGAVRHYGQQELEELGRTFSKHLVAGDLDGARTLLEQDLGVAGWLVSNPELPIWNGQLQLAIAKESGDFAAAAAWIDAELSGDAKEVLSNELSRELMTWLSTRVRPLLRDDTWLPQDYEPIATNAQLASRLMPTSSEVAEYRTIALVRASLMRAWQLLETANEGGDSFSTIDQAISEIDAACQRAGRVAEESILYRECKRVAASLTAYTVTGMFATEQNHSDDASFLRAAAQYARTVREKKWAVARDDLEYWERRLRVRAFLAEGKCEDAIREHERLSTVTSQRASAHKMKAFSDLIKDCNAIIADAKDR